MEKAKENKYVLFNKNYANRTKSIILYTEDFERDGDIDFNIEYETEYSNGDGQHGIASVKFVDILETYHANSFYEIVNELKSRYENDEKAWEKIVEEMKAKGLNVYDDEDESSW